MQTMSAEKLCALPNIGPVMARKLMRLGIDRPHTLRGRDPEELYARLAALEGAQPDPCVFDTLTAVVDHALQT